MTALQLGPLALPTAPLPWLAALVVALLLVPHVAARRDGALREPAQRCVWWATAIGFAVARAAYGDSPWNVVDLRDGGWSPWPGVAAALAWVGWQAARVPALRVALSGGAVVSAAVVALGWVAIGEPPRQPLPAIAVTDLQGRPASLEQLAGGRPAVVNLWASWCGPCRVEMPALAEAAGAEPSVRFLFVNQGEDAATVQRWLAGQHFRLPEVWIDSGSRLGPAVGSTGLPTTLFVDAQGRIVHRHMGLINQAAIRARLAALK